jgi:glutamate N-acetyltransferase/amino-acid N-acetyltransferase
MLPATRFTSMPTFAKAAGHSVTHPRGFRAAGVAAGIKRSSRLDVGLLHSDLPCVSAALFTRNAAAAAPVRVTRELGDCGALRTCVVNSGNANAYTGEEGTAAALRMRAAAAAAVGVPPAQVGVASTGVIGVPLPIDRVEHGIAVAAEDLSPDGGLRFASAIRTTDRHLKRGGLTLHLSEGEVRLGFAAKGAGMICPHVATMLCFVTCDAAVDADDWRRLVHDAVVASFNRITVDGQESTNDTVLALANGASGVRLGQEGLASLGQALTAALTSLAVAVVADGEGASTVVRLVLTGAADEHEAEVVARAVADSPLVKTAFYGDDPNWGRVVQSVGQALARLHHAAPQPAASPAPLRLDIAYGPVTVVAGDRECALSQEQRASLHRHMEEPEVDLSVHLHRGQAGALLYFSDLTHQYVTLNAEYTT